MMDDELKDFIAAPPARACDIEAAEAALGVTLPADYKAFLRLHDGADGWVGNTRLELWPAAALAARNRDHEIDRAAPGLVAIGGDGRDAGLALDMRDHPVPVVILPLTAPAHDRARRVANSFAGLFFRMTQPGGSLFGR
jgi:hypothetical protein